MPSSWFHHNYPKASFKLTKFLIVWLLLSVIAGFVINQLSAKEVKSDATTTNKQVATKGIDDALSQNKSLLTTIAVVAVIFLIIYIISDKTGITTKLGKWYSGIQSSQTTFKERPSPQDFNELQD